MGNYKNKPELLSPLTLAFVGDAYFSLYVRQRLVLNANRPVGTLHSLSVKSVKASAQAQIMRNILTELTEEETDIFKRGRNAHTSHTPKNQSGADYHWATGFEALVGFLHLKGEDERLNALLDKACEVENL